ncbi:MAG: polyphosphate:AMP phosphotransferase [Candidatus Binatia bacterium]|nr:polyphosphate:AMP phosphotransferase [Candidatus Binatia bacterium]
MLESAEMGRSESRDAYDERLPALRVELLNAQFDLRGAKFPVVLLVAGDDHIGCNAVVNVLHEWLDARYLRTHAFTRATHEERERPRFWRYWRALPGRGETALYVGAWPQAVVADRARRKIGKGEFGRRLGHIARFESTLVREGALVVKFWLHLPKKELQKRLRRAKKDPEQNWRVGETDGYVYENWNRVIPLAEEMLARTSTGAAPWHVIESSDARHRDLTIGETLLRELKEHTEGRPAPPPADAPTGGEVPPADGALACTDLTASLSGERYDKELAKRQRQLRKLSGRARKKGLSSVLLFEGWDAAGKGGAIRRITSALDASDYHVVPIAAPTQEELAHHYLWRFWRHLPRAGRMLLFDRSWYGRVLVERVEGYATSEAWQRAYSEIRDFEEQLAERGTPVLKFWLHIDPETQLERFKAREITPYKKYKITNDDYRNRERWEDYSVAIEEMIARTTTESAPWHVIAANDKKHARIQVLKTVCRALDRALD